MASSVCDSCVAFWKRRKDSSVSPMALGKHTALASEPWSCLCPSLSTPKQAGEHQAAPSSRAGSQEGWHTQGCTCCLSSQNRCSHSSPCSRCPAVPCRFSWTCTHSGDVSVGNRRERSALMRVKGKSGCFPYFSAGCSSRPWQEWGSACCAGGLIPARPLCPHRRRSRTPHARALYPGSPGPLLAAGEAAGSWMGLTHTKSNLAATWAGDTSVELSLQQRPALMHSWGTATGPCQAAQSVLGRGQLPAGLGDGLVLALPSPKPSCRETSPAQSTGGRGEHDLQAVLTDSGRCLLPTLGMTWFPSTAVCTSVAPSCRLLGE